MNTYRIFSFVCYDNSDNLNYNIILNRLVKFNFIYFIIRHDKDNNKIHYHVSIRTDNPTTILDISKKLQIPENYICVKDDNDKRYTLKSTISYLIHFYDKDKYHYNIDEIITNKKDLVNKYYDLLTGGSGESQEIKDILLFIEQNRPNAKELLFYCVECNYLKTFKKYSYYLNQVIKEERY